MDAVHDRRFLRFKRAGGCHVRRDHEVFDEAVRIQALTRRDRFNPALFVEDDLPFADRLYVSGTLTDKI